MSQLLGRAPAAPTQVTAAAFPVRPRSSREPRAGGWGAGALGRWGVEGGKGPQPLPVSAGLGGDTKVSRASPPTGQFRKSAFTFPFLGGGGAEEELFQGNSFPCM